MLFFYSGDVGSGPGLFMLVLYFLVIAAIIIIPIVLFAVVLVMAFKDGAIARTKKNIDAACGIVDRKSSNEFKASWTEYLVKVIIRVLISSFGWITFGFARAYAITEFRKWKYERTWIEGKQMVFVGVASDYWVKRLIWTLLGVVTFGVYWILFRPVREEQYLCENLHFVGEEVGSKVSRFNGGWIDYFLMNVTSRVMMCTGIGLPFALSMRYNFIYANRQIDDRRFVFHGSWNSVFAIFIYWMLLYTMTLGLYVWVLGWSETKWILDNITTEAVEKEKPVAAAKTA